jgi:hypothetical protein
MRYTVLTIIVILIFSSACQKKYSITEDEKSIEQLNKKWNENVLSGHRLYNADLFTDDGIRIEAGKICSGKDSIRSLLNSQTVQRQYIQQENKTQKIWSSKDFITAEIIQKQVFIQNETGDTITKRNAAIVIFKRQIDGTLKIAYQLKSELKD